MKSQLYGNQSRAGHPTAGQTAPINIASRLGFQPPVSGSSGLKNVRDFIQPSVFMGSMQSPTKSSPQAGERRRLFLVNQTPGPQEINPFLAVTIQLRAKFKVSSLLTISPIMLMIISPLSRPSMVMMIPLCSQVSSLQGFRFVMVFFFCFFFCFD
jgi:hypothetical protein